MTMLSMTGATGLTEGEQVVLRLHRHWKTVLGPFLVLAATVAALLVALIYLPSATALARLGLGAVALIIVVVLVLGPLLRWRTTSYELTNRRLRRSAHRSPCRILPAGHRPGTLAAPGSGGCSIFASPVLRSKVSLAIRFRR